jgi:tRNA-2-methylthio-N6-dimethylallyladenosine synthase
MKLIDDIEFDNSFSFIFSPRPGTPAANLHDDTPHEVKLARLQRLQAVINGNVKRYNDAMVGSIETVLVESPATRNSNELQGRTPTNRVVNFEGSRDLIGQLVKVKITHSNSFSLRGDLMEMPTQSAALGSLAA